MKKPIALALCLLLLAGGVFTGHMARPVHAAGTTYTYNELVAREAISDLVGEIFYPGDIFFSDRGTTSPGHMNNYAYIELVFSANELGEFDSWKTDNTKKALTEGVNLPPGVNSWRVVYVSLDSTVGIIISVEPHNIIVDYAVNSTGGLTTALGSGSGDCTIWLTGSFTRSGAIDITGRNFKLYLNDETLTVSNGSGHGVSLTGGATLTVCGPGTLNITYIGANSYGILADASTFEVTGDPVINVTAAGGGVGPFAYNGVYAHSGGSITVTGNVSGSGDDCRGVIVHGNGSAVAVTGSVTVTDNGNGPNGSIGVLAGYGGKAYITGAVTATGTSATDISIEFDPSTFIPLAVGNPASRNQTLPSPHNGYYWDVYTDAAKSAYVYLRQGKTSSGGGSSKGKTTKAATVEDDDGEGASQQGSQEPGYEPMKPDKPAGTAVDATKTNNPLTIDGKQVDFPAVKVDGWNWLKLRDVAALLNGTAKQFSIGYDRETNTIIITTGGEYEPIGDELLDMLTGDFTALASGQKIMFNGQLIDVAAYNIDGYNYFRLRDLMILLDVLVIYNEETEEVTLDLTKPYSE